MAQISDADYSRQLFTTAHGMLDIVRSEKARRMADTEREFDDGAEWAFDGYREIEEPLLNELCLLLLVTIWHQVERRLVALAATVADKDDGPLTRSEYDQRLKEMREAFKRTPYNLSLRDRRGRLTRIGLMATLRFGVGPFPAPGSHFETLRLLANSYKHDPGLRPDPELTAHLAAFLEAKPNPFAPLPESTDLREALAQSLGLTTTDDYCEIVDALLGHATALLRGVRQRNQFRKVMVSTRLSSFGR